MMKVKIFFIMIILSLNLHAFIQESEIFKFLGGNMFTSSFIFGQMIENKVKRNQMKKMVRVRCTISGVYSTDPGGSTYKDAKGKSRPSPPIGLVLYVTNCSRASGLGSSKTNLAALYILGRDIIPRYTSLRSGNIRVFSRIAAVDRKKSVVGFIY